MRIIVHVTQAVARSVYLRRSQDGWRSPIALRRPRLRNETAPGALLPETQHLERRILIIVVCTPVLDRERLPDRGAEQLLQLVR